MLQSAGAGGYGVAAVAGAVQGFGGVVASSAGAMAFLKKGGKKGDGDAAVKGDEEKEEKGDKRIEIDNNDEDEEEKDRDIDKKDEDGERYDFKL